MPYTVEGAKLPIKMWTDPTKVEEEAKKQLRHVANLPFVLKHVAVMPDVHVGKGATIGTVAIMQDAIPPSMVGVDLGCGMVATSTNVSRKEIENFRPAIRLAIENAVPRGHNEHSKVENHVVDWFTNRGFYKALLPDDLFHKARRQMGTLGSGNHFIELCYDQEDRIWVLLHSGSRHIGLQLANYYIRQAKEDMARFHYDLPDPELAYLTKDRPAFDDYMYDLRWAQDYAAENRSQMLTTVISQLSAIIGRPVLTFTYVNCRHNYATYERHYDEDVIVVRKGAIRAGVDELGVVPGSMGAASYIVKGKGNAESFCSCAHGAGRRLGRAAAKKQYTVQDLVALTEGIECRKDAGVLDEIPAAYKSIEQVMQDQTDLVEQVNVLRQVINVKG